MTTRKMLLGLAALALAGLAGCSDDDEYVSRLPEIHDVTLVNQDGSPALRVGDEVTVTVVQGRKGKLLFQADYGWSATPEGLNLRAVKNQVPYDNEPDDPQATFTATQAGSFTLTFEGKYQKSGTTDGLGIRTGILANGGSVTYEDKGLLQADITVRKTFRISE